MYKNNIKLGKKATKRFLRGIKVPMDAIRLSYGPYGVNALIQCEDMPFNKSANDAETIIQAMWVEDAVEKQALDLWKELSSKANKDSADGRKTTLIIAYSILRQGLKLNMPPMELKRRLDSFIPLIENKLNEQRKEITVENIKDVASIAGESDRIGELLAGIYAGIGKDGIIHLESSQTGITSYKIIEGIRFADTGYLSSELVYEKGIEKPKKAIYENPAILVTKRKVTHINDLNPLLTTLEQQGKKDLVIFTDDMDSDVASRLIKAHKDKVFNILIIKAPVIWKQFVFEDFARVTGSTIIEDATGLTFKNMNLGHLGTCGKITVDKEETLIIGGSDISEHIADLKTKEDFDSKLRLSWLTNKTAILKLGGNNEQELHHYMLKVSDAIHSSRLALKEGVVGGAGQALFRASESLLGGKIGDIISKALREPHRQLRKNAGLGFWQKLKVDESVVDALVVVRNAVRNGIALASTVLTDRISITLPPKSAAQIAQEALQNKGLRM